MDRLGHLLVALALVSATACSAASAPTPSPTKSAPTAAISIHGTVKDLDTGKPVEGVCVTLGRPGAICWATTDRSGTYVIDGTGIVEPSDTEWELYFVKKGEYPAQPSGRFKLTGGSVQVDGGIRRNPG